MRRRRDRALRILITLTILGGLVGTAAPGRAQFAWDQAYGSPANTSFIFADTRLPVAPRWAFQLDGPVTAGGPAVGLKDGTIWVGTATGTIWAFFQNGDVRCTRHFRDSTIQSTPAILPDAGIAVLVTRRVLHPLIPPPLQRNRRQTSLVRLTSNCEPVWQVDLPTYDPDVSSIATGSVKRWSIETTSFLFVHGRKTTVYSDIVSHNELLVYDDNGQIFARHRTGNKCVVATGGGWKIGLTGLAPAVDSVPPLYPDFGWPDSTPAIAEVPGVTPPSKPFVAVTDHDCAVSLDLYQFDPDAATVAGRLIKLWGAEVESQGTLLSSPAISDGLVVFGTSGHRVRAYDVATRSLRWSYDTTHPVMHPPAMAEDAWIVQSDYLVHFLKRGTNELLDTLRPQPFPTEGALGGLATSLNEVVVPHFEELGIWSHDLRELTHALTEEVFRTSSPALTTEGRLYVVGQRGDLAVLYAFGPP